MKKKWVVKPPCEKGVVEDLSKQLNINCVLASLLVQRGITTFEEARNFFRPELKMLHDPFLMKDMDKAIDRIDAAMRQKEKIVIYGDYDVDGTTAVSLVWLFFKARYEHISFYIPDRNLEGYGISFKGIDWAKENGFTLIIALDCGIKANDKIDYANKLGVDFIICDHHRPGTEIPDAVAVLDPKRDDCSYPYKELSGCGIGFKLVQGYAQKHNLGFEILEPFLDLVAVSIAADIVPITGENRILAYYGLKRINSKPRAGIKAIIEVSGYKKELAISDVVFTIAPRINAAGRIESGNQAVELLISDCADSAKFKGDDINKQNITRKSLDQSITEQALALIAQDEKFLERKSTVLYGPEWHKGVIGIVASRIMSEWHYRPTIILTGNNGHVNGSARSVKDFDIYNAIESCSDLLEQFGGHMYAAGLTLKPENVEAFRERFEEVVSSTIEDRMLVREIEIDAELKLSDITQKFYNILKQFAPFGPGNMAPVFKTADVSDTGYCRMVGNKIPGHLKLTLKEKGHKKEVDGIAFQLGERLKEIQGKQTFDICYHIEENIFRDERNLQLNIKDIQF
ncbi:MAG TPA: single-stranded-DNA-specific exonuclease RecJ [Bacteroidia bacterium]|nr:single-stranded-DNA-specific exonuclease RecJ [Bacteroidia bacterium]